jgi:hypothetical protein
MPNADATVVSTAALDDKRKLTLKKRIGRAG